MTAELVYNTIALIAATLFDHNGECPSGEIYALLMGSCTFNQYSTILNFGDKEGLWTVANSHLVTLSSKGHGLAENIKDLLKNTRA